MFQRREKEFKNMDRRTFFKKSLGASVAIGTYFTSSQFSKILAFSQRNYDLIAIKGGEPEDMFDKGSIAIQSFC